MSHSIIVDNCTVAVTGLIGEMLAERESEEIKAVVDLEK